LLFLLDTNVLIDANRDYYPLNRVPEFWEWLIFNGESKKVKIPLEIYDEICDGNDLLAKWIKKPDVKQALILNEEVDINLIREVISRGYGDDLSDIEVEKLGRDPFLIAYTLLDKNNRCLVTTETSRPSAIKANRKIPDICNTLGLSSCNTFEFIKALDFRTNWNKG